MTELGGSSYGKLLIEIKQRISKAQYEALKVVNKELIALYWDIGIFIITRQQGETWGKSVVKNLSHDLQAEFPGIQGFSTANLWRMKLFYETYYKDEKLSPLVAFLNPVSGIKILASDLNFLQHQSCACG